MRCPLLRRAHHGVERDPTVADKVRPERLSSMACCARHRPLLPKLVGWEQVRHIAIQSRAKPFKRLERYVLNLVLDSVDRGARDASAPGKLVLGLLSSELSDPSREAFSEETLLSAHARMLLDRPLHMCRLSDQPKIMVADRRTDHAT